MPPKRVLMGMTYYLPNISGVTLYGVIVAEELVKRHYEVTVACSGKGDDEINGVKIKRIGGFNLGKGFIMPAYPLISFNLVKNSDIVNCHLPSVESFWLLMWAKILGKKSIITHHCEFQFTGIWSNKIIAALTYPVHFGEYLLADKIVAYTEDYARTSIFLRFFKNKITYILPPVKVDETKKIFNFGPGKIVGFVGRIGWEKGLQFLIEAMNKVKAKLVLAGPYKEVAGDKTYEKLKKIINKKVEFIGPVEHKHLKAVYEKLDCLVLPSTDNLETFGIVQAEAMVCGCPVVASNLPGVRVPVKMTGMGLIANVGDTADLEQKINEVLQKDKKYYQLKAKNLNRFNYLKTVDEYEKLFDAGKD